jgi:hypothetical protein
VKRQPRQGFRPYVAAVAAAIGDLPGDRADQPFPLIAELVKATFSWCSEPVHRAADVSLRKQARFELALGTALYGLAVRAQVAAFET